MAGMNYGRKYTLGGSKRAKSFPLDKEGIFELPDGKYILRMERQVMKNMKQMTSVAKSADKKQLEKMYKEIKNENI